MQLNICFIELAEEFPWDTVNKLSCSSHWCFIVFSWWSQASSEQSRRDPSKTVFSTAHFLKDWGEFPVFYTIEKYT